MSTAHSKPLSGRIGALASVVAASIALLAVPAGAAGGGSTSSGGWGSATNPRTTATVVGKAAPDECWKPPTDPNNASQYGQYSTTAPTLVKGKWTCPTGYVPKVNQAYVWGLTRTGTNLWFGTVANTQCLVMGSYLQMTTPMLNQTSVCEFGQSPTVQQGVSLGTTTIIPPGAIPAGLGDWRPPHLFRYTMGSSSQPVDLATLQGPAAKAALTVALDQTVGIRSADSMDDPFNSGHKIIIFAGPSLAQQLMMFAFRDDGSYLGSKSFGDYNDIRRWVTTTDNKVFTGVGLTNAGAAKSPSGTSGGAVLQWTPPATTSGTIDDYLSFTPITYLDSDAAELTLAGDKLVVGTWPSAAHEASVWIASDPISTISSSTTWTRIWTVSDYDPDAVTAATYGAGAMAYYGGYVYWGTMHVPGQAFEAAEQVHPGGTSQGELANFVGSYRAISIFRVPVSDPTPANVQMLYGEAQLPAYDYGTNSWQTVNNNMGGIAGLYGSSGFGNEFNNYTWSMAVYGGKLYVGTMDWSYLASQAWPQIAQQLGLPTGTPNPLDEIATYGADLWRFPSTTSAATAVSTNGVGNYLNYGLRNMLSVEDSTSANNGLYLGMADPENLATTGGGPKGGWELIRLVSTTTTK